MHSRNGIEGKKKQREEKLRKEKKKEWKKTKEEAERGRRGRREHPFSPLQMRRDKPRTGRRVPVPDAAEDRPGQSRSSSLIEVLERVCASTRLTITAQ